MHIKNGQKKFLKKLKGGEMKMVVFIIEKIIREKEEKKKPKVTKKEMIIDEFYNETNLTLKGIAKKYKTSYEYIRKLHAEFLQETQ